jgi:hypothetical protein
MHNYYEKYLKYKNKYLELKGSGKKSKGKTEIEVVEDSELIKYFKANDINIRTLTSTFARNIEEQKNTVDSDGNTALHIYMKNGGSDEGVIDFIFPSEAKIGQKNKDGDTFSHVAARHPKNEDIVELLWMKGGDVAKDVRNKAGFRLLELADDLKKKDPDNFKKLHSMLLNLYYGDAEDLKALFLARKEAAERIARSGFDVRRREEASGVSVAVSDESERGAIGSVKIASSSDLEENYSRYSEYFTFGLEDIMENIGKGIMYETVYISNASVKVPSNSNILSVKIGDFSSDTFNEFVKVGINMLGLVAKSHRAAYDRILYSE